MDNIKESNKIIIIGSPGSGKSTFARKLQQKTNLPLYYLDMLFHNPDKTTSSKEEFDNKLKEIIATDSWIIDGNYQRTMPLRFEAAEQIFLFDLSLDYCLRGAESRIGQKREDMPWVENELDPDFRQYIMDFPKDQLPIIYGLIEKYRETKEIIIFKSHEEADEYLEEMNSTMNKDMCVRCGEGVINIRVGAIIMKDDKVLMVKNNRDDYYYSVGGRIQFGETAEDAILREVKEELGFEMEIDRLGFIKEAYFYGTVGSDQERLIYEPAFYYYMKVPEDFELENKTFLEDGTPEYLEWVPIDTTKTIYPEFFKTELKNPSKEIKHMVADER